jgi:hypothetical protein
MGTPRKRQVAVDRAECRYALVLEDPVSGERLELPVSATLRELEILGSAGRFYGTSYRNPERPADQVARRRRQAAELGMALWEATVDLVDIEPAEARWSPLSDEPATKPGRVRPLRARRTSR